MTLGESWTSQIEVLSLWDNLVKPVLNLIETINVLANYTPASYVCSHHQGVASWCFFVSWAALNFFS